MKKKTIKKDCLFCKKPFPAKQERTKFCSANCAAKQAYKDSKTGVKNESEVQKGLKELKKMGAVNKDGGLIASKLKKQIADDFPNEEKEDAVKIFGEFIEKDDLPNKTSQPTWIKTIEDFCNKENITPEDLIKVYRQKIVKQRTLNEELNKQGIETNTKAVFDRRKAKLGF